jgi:hypothetical protein
MLSKTEMLDPIRDMPKSDKVEPSLEKERNDKELPKHK